MIRNALIIAGASFVLMLGCLAGVAALAGPVILKDGWTIPFDEDGDRIVIRENGKVIHQGRHVGLAGRAASPMVDRQFAWTGKDTLTLNLPVDVTYVQGDDAKIVVSGPQSFVDRLRITDGHIGLGDSDSIDHGSLTIDAHGVRIASDSDRVRITVIAPAVTRFELNGSGDLEINRYDQPMLALALNGSGDVTAEGKSQQLELVAAGSGDADLERLEARDAKIATSGSGDAEIDVSHEVQIAISGSGDVSLNRKPVSETSTVSGSGEVRHSY